MTEEKMTQLEMKLVEIIGSAQDGVSQALLFGKEHIPEVLTELLWWHGVSSFGLFLLCALLTGSAIRNFFLSEGIKSRQAHFKRVSESESNELEVSIFITLQLFFVVGGVVGLICLLQNMAWLQIVVAPKLYLLEYAVQLSK